ncbi:hypothetical protein B0T49_15500 [Chromobacterium violaceum]|uniref:pyocin knob domain-containing protein n=1 Tax=Chromobacterium violaceum TaxID=536 RepID=UPI0009DA1487|nr:pyocin knob domain-containing protein [Chromobacterium violaceum]OQS47508.1 hypothetical protein B0T48_12570 [Chromobacterium violaceum]OQS48399.1 hypothetical protein B0T49_15500 [Chromobacterium violaceum]
MATDVAWYRVGKISVQQGALTVSGQGTNWAGQTNPGDILIGPDGKLYEIATVEAAALKLRTPYAGGNATGQAYAIVRNFTGSPLGEVAAELAKMQRRWMVTLAGFRDVLLTDQEQAVLYDELGEGRQVMSWLAISRGAREGLAAMEAARRLVIDNAADLIASRNAAAASEKSAAASQAAAASSESVTKASQEAAASSQNAAKTSQVAAGMSEKNAAASATAAAASAKAGSDSAAAAAASAASISEAGRVAEEGRKMVVDSIVAVVAASNAAAVSEKNAAASQAAAASSESVTKASQAAAATSQNAAKASQVAAGTSEKNAATSATAAAASAKAGSDSAAAAAASASSIGEAARVAEEGRKVVADGMVTVVAASKATAQSEKNAASSQVAAAASERNASASATAAAASAKTGSESAAVAAASASSIGEAARVAEEGRKVVADGIVTVVAASKATAQSEKNAAFSQAAAANSESAAKASQAAASVSEQNAEGSAASASTAAVAAEASAKAAMASEYAAADSAGQLAGAAQVVAEARELLKIAVKRGDPIQVNSQNSEAYVTLNMSTDANVTNSGRLTAYGQKGAAALLDLDAQPAEKNVQAKIRLFRNTSGNSAYLEVYPGDGSSDVVHRLSGKGMDTLLNQQGGRLLIGKKGAPARVDLVGESWADTFRAAKGYPDNGDSSSVGFAFASDSDTGMFADYQGTNPSSGTSNLTFYINSKQVMAIDKDGRFWAAAHGFLDQAFATQAFVNTAVAKVVDGAPATLNTLKRISEALNNDANIIKNISVAIEKKPDVGLMLGRSMGGYTKPGFYTYTPPVSSPTVIDGPQNANGGFEVISFGDEPSRAQIAISTTWQKAFFRTGSQGVHSPWREIFHEGNFNPKDYDPKTPRMAMLAQYTKATLPPASSCAGGVVMVTDFPKGPEICYSTGSKWKMLGSFDF